MSAKNRVPRLYQAADGEALHAIFVTAVREIGRHHYNDQQILAWAASAPDPSDYTERAQDGRVLLVATDDQDVPIAYIDLEADGPHRPSVLSARPGG
jgi:putative acetyltransferase